jgi:hypothetical protein
VGLGFELNGFTLAKQMFYCLSHTVSPGSHLLIGELTRISREKVNHKNTE